MRGRGVTGSTRDCNSSGGGSSPPNPTISILIATYGDPEWRDLAQTRALPSAQTQGAHEVLCDHQPDGTIKTARNDLAAVATGTHLLFLDADDELAPGYVTAMQDAAGPNPDPGVLFTPAVSYVRHGQRRQPRFWPPVSLEQANWLVIGTIISRELFWEVGGFMGEPHGLEDFSLWGRCHRRGAIVVKVPKAVYVAYFNPESKHHKLIRENKAEYDEWYEKTKRLIAGEA